MMPTTNKLTIIKTKDSEEVVQVVTNVVKKVTLQETVVVARETTATMPVTNVGR